ncbi:MAG: 2-C-methyl-D-erythritol 4-phosphate cytidylyltransferase [Bacteroidales bacterium]|jgi:2-C-methyl-D-erythritol 4-phosphate cytidylyltransferase|nr:2-C-methyl-D-erythritol 4-phosphate cytidylyltransferase [Bacteroidales bacterium]
MDRYVVIVAGGIGSRMGEEIPKQFLPLHNKPIIIHTINQFLIFDPDIQIVAALPELHFPRWKTLAKKYNLFENIAVVFGGQQRFDTVKNALKIIPDGALVAIHDAVRPIVSIKTIAQSFKTAEKFGSAIPYVLPGASVRFDDENGNIAPLDRNKVRIIQTPQTFHSTKLKEAYLQSYQENFTDDAAVWEKAGNKLTFFEGDTENIKITLPIDLKIAEYLILHE